MTDGDLPTKSFLKTFDSVSFFPSGRRILFSIAMMCQGNLLIADGGLRVVLADFDMSVKTQGLQLPDSATVRVVLKGQFFLT